MVKRNQIACTSIDLTLDVDASITEINSRGLRLVSQMKIVPCVHSKSMCAIYIQGKLYLDMGLRKPKKRMEFDHPPVSDKSVCVHTPVVMAVIDRDDMA